MKRNQTLQKKAQDKVESIEHFLKFLAINRPRECLEIASQVEKTINDYEIASFQESCCLFDQEAKELTDGTVEKEEDSND